MAGRKNETELRTLKQGGVCLAFPWDLRLTKDPSLLKGEEPKRRRTQQKQEARCGHGHSLTRNVQALVELALLEAGVDGDLTRNDIGADSGESDRSRWRQAMGDGGGARGTSNEADTTTDPLP